MVQDSIKRLAMLVRNAQGIVFFGGAGVSTESGIPDFRSAGGLYSSRAAVRPETVLSHDFFMDRPSDFFAFYRKHMLYPDAVPNAAHKILAGWEARGILSSVITQNIDGLHQAAGSRQVFELHGSVWRNRCLRCGEAFPLAVIAQSTDIPRCRCGGIIKPDVVLYGEGLDEEVVSGALRAISASSLVIIGGTSLQVYPAAGLIMGYRGAVAVINKSPTALDSRAQAVIASPIAQALQDLDACLV